MFLGKGVLKICKKSTGEKPWRGAISIKLESKRGNLMESTLPKFKNDHLQLYFN